MGEDGYTIAHESDLEQSGRWSLVRRSLGIEAFGINVVEIEPGGRIPEHDERARDQEEVYIVQSGTVAAVIDGVEHRAPAGTYVRLDPEPSRAIVNVGDEPARILMVSAPRSSGYEPMDWA